MKSKMKRIFAAILSLIFILSAVTLSISARGRVDEDAVCSLTLSYNYDSQSFSGLCIRIYRIAEITETNDYFLTGSFSDYPVAINSVKSRDEWKQLSSTILGYIVADSILPNHETLTDENGEAHFENLATGLYLVQGVRSDYNDGYCEFETFVISVPNTNENDEWMYDVTAYPKSIYVEVEPEDTTYTVNKLWKDAGNENKRSDSVTIELYKDGEFIEEVVLSSKNDWSYSWTAPLDGAVWQAVESNVPNGYTVTIEQEGNYFTVINTYDDPEIPPKTGDTSQMPIYIILLTVSGIGLVIVSIGALREKRK